MPLTAILLAMIATTTAPTKPVDKITVACYYFGNYHPGDPRNTITKGPNWSEWDLVKAAKPRFPGHYQPNVPLWGYTDESNPKDMAQKIAAASDAGIDAFIFDWYYYNDGPFLEGTLDKGFLKARNRKRIKFALMWANHDWLDVHPAHLHVEPKLLYPGKVTPETFVKATNLVIHDYMLQSSYWKIDGKPYFSFYDLGKLVENFGSVAATRAALDDFRARAVKAGLKGLNLNAVAWGQPTLPGESQPTDLYKLIRDLGFDSATSYTWVHYVGLPQQQTDYNSVRDGYFRFWDSIKGSLGIPYYPNVMVGWDPSPRADQNDPYVQWNYTFSNTVSDNTPANLKEALQMTIRKMLADKNGPRILNIESWNEWTEGSYLEPDKRYGYQKLQAIKDVLHPASK